MNSYLKFKKPIYDSCETLYYIKDIYLQTEPYNDLFSLTFNNMFKKSYYQKLKNKNSIYRWISKCIDRFLNRKKKTNVRC